MHSTSSAPPRFLQVPAGLLSSVRSFIVGDRDPVAAVTALREIGYGLGDEVYSALGGQDGDALHQRTAADFWRSAEEFFAERGWGRLTFQDVHPAVGALDLDDWVESASGGGPRGCHISTGIFTALLERLSGGGVVVMEVPSPSGGSRLLFARGDVLGAVYEKIQAGQTPGAAIAALG